MMLFLVCANCARVVKEGRRKAPIVILAKQTCDEIRQEISRIDRPKADIIVRSGNPNSISDLQKVESLPETLDSRPQTLDT